MVKAAPLGGIPQLAPPVPQSHAQTEQMPLTDSLIGTVTDKVKGALSGSGGNSL